MKTRVLCTYGATYAGGISRMLVDGLPHLSRQPGIQLAVADLYGRESINRMFRATGMPIVHAGVNGAPYTSVRSGLARQFDRVRAVPRHVLMAHRLKQAAQTADVLYVHTYKELALAAWSCVPPRSGARLVWHCHGLDSVSPGTAQLARMCTRIIAISETVAGRLTEIGVSRNRIATIVNAVDVERIVIAAAQPPISPLPAKGARRAVLVPTASIRETKGIHVLLDAARKVPEIAIWIAGDTQDQAAEGYAKRLRTLSQSPELMGRVHFIGFRQDIYSVMQAADIVCVPSVCREGFGLVAAEAMGLGKPVIVSNRGALPDVVPQGKAGIVFDPDRPQELTSALQRLTTDSEYTQRLAAYAGPYVRLRFSYIQWSNMVAQVLREASSQPGDWSAIQARRQPCHAGLRDLRDADANQLNKDAGSTVYKAAGSDDEMTMLVAPFAERVVSG